MSEGILMWLEAMSKRKELYVYPPELLINKAAQKMIEEDENIFEKEDDD